jgi:transglutaminase-like putative cysteine protease
MAADDQEAPGGRLFFLTALLTVVVTATVGFGRVFQGHSSTLKLALAGLAAVLVAWALERRSILLSVAATLVGLGFAVGLAVFPMTTWFGLPTAETLEASLEALSRVGTTAQVQVAPAVPLPPLLMAALAAVWSAGFALHSLAGRARSPFLSILPPASLLAFSNIVMEDGVRPAYVVAFLAASLMVLFGDAIRRVGQWGPVSSWRTPFVPRTDGFASRLRSAVRLRASATGRPARRVASGAVIAALGAAWILPGFRSPGLLTLSGDTSPLHVAIDPVVEIKPALLNNKPVQLFTVRSARPSYWRFLSLDRFDGNRWTSSNLEAKGGSVVGSGPLVSTGHIFIDVDASGPGVDYLEQDFTLNKLSQPWLPAAYHPVGISVPGSVVRYDSTGDVIFAPNGTYPGFSYSIVSSLRVPTPAELSIVDVPPAPDIQPYIQLPDRTPRAILRIARQITEGESTVYGKVLAIQDYLRDNFRYDLRVPAGHDNNHILTFLTKTKAGYCEQFAGSMAVLLRALGIPARVAVGFTPGRLDERNGLWSVTLQNAHAWVEVLFPGFGWLAFEPTPTRANPVARPYTDFERANLGGIAGCSNPDPTQCVLPGTEGLEPTQQGPNASQRPRVGDAVSEGLPLDSRSGPTPLLPVPNARRSWLGPAVLGALVVLVLIGLGIPLSKTANRRLALSRARIPRVRVLTAFDLMAGQAADLGFGRQPQETLLEYRTRLRQRVSSLDGDLDHLTRLTSVAAYSEAEITGAEADAALVSARRVTGDLRKAAGTVRRMTAWFRLQGAGLRS